MTGTVGIIAGSGVLPIEIAATVEAHDRQVFVVGIADEAAPTIERFRHQRLGWGRFGSLFDLLRREGVSEVVFAGGVAKRPDLRLGQLDLQTVKALPSLLRMLMSGDDTILSGLAKMFEASGFRMVGVAEVAPALLLAEGTTCARLKRRSVRQIELATQAVRALGPFDVGQAAVVCGRRIVAVEGLEGTDQMLARVESLRDSGRLSDRRDGVLVKVPKPQQDRRVDLPAIGPSTVLNARLAGLDGIAGEAGNLVVLERERTMELARTHNIFLHGMTA